MTISNSLSNTLTATKIEFADLDTIKDWYMHPKDLYLDYSADFKEIPSVPDTIKVSETPKTMEQGIIYSQKIEFEYKTGVDVPANTPKIHKLHNSKGVVKIYFENNTQRIIGSPANPVFISFRKDYKKFNFKNKVQITCKSLLPMLYEI